MRFGFHRLELCILVVAVSRGFVRALGVMRTARILLHQELKLSYGFLRCLRIVKGAAGLGQQLGCIHDALVGFTEVCAGEINLAEGLGHAVIVAAGAFALRTPVQRLAHLLGVLKLRLGQLLLLCQSAFGLRAGNQQGDYGARRQEAWKTGVETRTNWSTASQTESS